jgi:Fe2+ or Zn2+ uptake regulation protein
MRLDTEHGFDLDLSHLAIHGTCKQCRYMDTAAYI